MKKQLFLKGFFAHSSKCNFNLTIQEKVPTQLSSLAQKLVKEHKLTIE